MTGDFVMVCRAVTDKLKVTEQDDRKGWSLRPINPTVEEPMATL